VKNVRCYTSEPNYGMKFFPPPSPIMLYSNLSPEECARRLNQAIDAKEFSLVWFSGFRGGKPFGGGVAGWQFRLFKCGYRNAFPPILSGTFIPQKRGTRVEGSIDIEPISKIAICLLSLCGVLILTPILVYSLGGPTVPRWLAGAFACASIIFAALAPCLVRGNGRNQEREITDFLCTQLEAGEDSCAFECGCES
jgi:hypothetical protein